MTWYDQNELIAYPLTGADDNAIPSDVLVDCIVNAPIALGTQLVLRSISVTGLLVSVILRIGSTDVAYLTVPMATLQTHLAIPVVPLAPGVSGFIAFGSGVHQHQLRVDGAYAFMPESLISYQYDAVNPTMTVGGHAMTGLVKLVPGPGLRITGATLRVKREDAAIVVTPCALISITNPALLSDPIPESVRPAEGDPAVQPIATINGVAPDSGGNITLVVETILQQPTDPVITLVGTQLQDGGTPCA
jgi:hypothetical protein